MNTGRLGQESNFCDFLSVHLVSGLYGSSETRGNFGDFRDNCYLQAVQPFAHNWRCHYNLALAARQNSAYRSGCHKFLNKTGELGNVRTLASSRNSSSSYP
jgi:hypothetical protein